MGSYEHNHVSDTHLALALGLGSVANLIRNSPEMDQREANNRVSLDLNLALKEQSDEDGEMNTANGSRKKLQLSKQQTSILEETFKRHSTLNTDQKNSLASQLNLTPRQVEVWFQNRRARTKLKLTETHCERWKKSYEEMAEENKRLKLEIENLQISKRIKRDGPTNFSEVPMYAAGGFICPTCRRDWPVIGTSVGSGDHRPVVLKPKPKYGGVKLP